VLSLSSKGRVEARKQQILGAAERVFALKGFQEATISDVAREAKVSDATIYEYFPSKEELLFSIPGETARRGKEEIESVLKMVRGAANKIRVIIYHYLRFYNSHPEYASVAMLVLKPHRKFMETAAYRDVQDLSRLILQVVKDGMEDGEIAPDVNPYLARAMLLGTIDHVVTRRVLRGKPEDLEALVDPLTDMLIKGLGARMPKRAVSFRISLDPEDGLEEDPAGVREEKSNGKRVRNKRR
jgi:TetR/AcrR family transcriptional regulator, fatty acid metabolism regulator protein